MRSITLVAIAAASLVAAKQNFTINPSEIDANTQLAWCTSQTGACTILCGSQHTSVNNCSATTLTYDCLCKNGSSPGLQNYKDTMDYFICQQAYGDCIQNSGGTQIGTAACETNIRDFCGTLNLTDYNEPTTSSNAKTSTTVSLTASATVAAVSSNIAAGAAPIHNAAVGNGLLVAAAGLAIAML